ncbi:MAG: pyridoxamine 5'-phosphate oxidase family protein [Acidimicrobiales bacterium]
MAGSERDQLRMDEQEVRAFVEEGRRVQVTTNGPDGWPHVVPMSYVVLDGAVVLWTDGNSRKVRNLRDDDRMTCLFERGDDVSEFRAVQLRGNAEIVDDYDRSLDAGRALFSRYSGGPLDSRTEDYVRLLAHQRVAVRLHVQGVVSWDHRKMAVDVRTIGS